MGGDVRMIIWVRHRTVAVVLWCQGLSWTRYANYETWSVLAWAGCDGGYQVDAWSGVLVKGAQSAEEAARRLVTEWRLAGCP